MATIKTNDRVIKGWAEKPIRAGQGVVFVGEKAAGEPLVAPVALHSDQFSIVVAGIALTDAEAGNELQIAVAGEVSMLAPEITVSPVYLSVDQTMQAHEDRITALEKTVQEIIKAFSQRDIR